MPVGPAVLTNAVSYLRDEETIKAINSGTRKLIQNIDWQLTNLDNHNKKYIKLYISPSTIQFNNPEMASIISILTKACEIYMNVGWGNVSMHSSDGSLFLIFKTKEQLEL